MQIFVRFLLKKVRFCHLHMTNARIYAYYAHKRTHRGTHKEERREDAPPCLFRVWIRYYFTNTLPTYNVPFVSEIRTL